MFGCWNCQGKSEQKTSPDIWDTFWKSMEVWLEMLPFWHQKALSLFRGWLSIITLICVWFSWCLKGTGGSAKAARSNVTHLPGHEPRAAANDLGADNRFLLVERPPGRWRNGRVVNHLERWVTHRNTGMTQLISGDVQGLILAPTAGLLPEVAARTWDIGLDLGCRICR